ncbi:MAG: penicillin acylase family protein [Ideonella sp.]|nr:penicillin acylase family protein [Ideonella sp.]
MTWWRRSLWGLLALGALGAIAAAVYSWRTMPTIDGELRVSGLEQPVHIERDADGIPTLKARNRHDLLFALGFVHAQDRLWQLETHRRIGAGRLAEAFGEVALPSDKFLRALGVRRAAAAQWARASADTRAAMRAYADGVNAFLATDLRARPPEMLVLGVQPQPWDPVDSYAWMLMMAYDLGGNWSKELLRLRLALRLPVARIDELLPPYPGEKPLPTADYAALFRALRLDAATATAALPSSGGVIAGDVSAFDRVLDRLQAAARPSGIEGVGSNNWVVAGSHTTTGAPLLANDPHLKLTVPALWYFARLEAPGIRVAGATMPGLPAVVLGQNEHIAWGFTNTNPDVQDLYIERLHPADPNQVQTPDGWAPLKTFDEVMKVRGKPDVKITVRESRHGPVISDAGIADDLLGNKARSAYAIALRWTALDPDNDTAAASFAMSEARDVASFIAAVKSWVVAPMQNMVVADRAGHIGWIAPGRVPLRKPANDLLGLVPAPGWDARYDWAGWVPADALPQQVDPARGWIATANQRVVPADYPVFLTSEWAPPFRQQRIEQLLSARPKHSIDDLAAIQADVKSLASAEMLLWLRRVQSKHPLAAAAQRSLDGFDGTMTADRAAPLLLWAWQRQLTQRVFADELGTVYERAIATRTLRDALHGVLERDDLWWCDDKTTPAAETCAQQSVAAFDAALDEWRQRLGDDVSQWRWGQVHQARSEHRPFSRVKLLARWFELRTPVGGDSFTVDVSRVLYQPDPTTGELFLAEHGPSLRALYDLADPKRSRFMHSTGQSGLPWSKWYANLMPEWARVQYLPLWGDGMPAPATLVLSPGG